jgi:hypothetical protein
MCTRGPNSGIGTTILFTTHTITSCLPAICPASGYVIGGNPSQSGATIVTTTDKNGHTVTYTQIPTGPGGGSNGGTGTGSPTGMPSGRPTCPANNNAQFSSPMGMVYQIMCDMLFTDETIETQTQDSLASCISSCDMYNLMSFMVASPCRGVSWSSDKNRDNCMLKSGSAGVYRRGVDSARLLSPNSGGGNNGTGTVGPGTGGGGTLVTGSMTAPPVLTTVVSGGSTIISTYISGGSTVVSTVISGGSTVLTTVVTGGSTIVTTTVSGGSTIVKTVPGGGSGGGGTGGGAGTGPGKLQSGQHVCYVSAKQLDRNWSRHRCWHGPRYD